MKNKMLNVLNKLNKKSDGQMSEFFQYLIEKGDLYIFFKNINCEIFIETLQTFDYYNEDNLYLYIDFYYTLYNNYIMVNDLSGYLADNFDNQLLQIYDDSFDYFRGLLGNYFN